MSTELPKLAVLASGRGSNLEALLQAVKVGRLNARIVAVVSDRADARALDLAQAGGVPALHVPVKGRVRADYDAELVQTLRNVGTEWVALAGFMRILSPAFLQAFPGHILNIHPSLLPAFPGLAAQTQALHAGVSVAGCTVHFVDDGVDTGPIVMQATVPVLPGDTEQSLAARILGAEHRTYAKALQLVLSGQAQLKDGKVVHKPRTAGVRFPRKALISVHDKAGLIPLAQALARHQYELISTGKTRMLLAEAGLTVTDIAQYTGFAECLGGRVKTLHPLVHGGLLARTDEAQDLADLAMLGIEPMDLAVVNLYPFEATAARPGATHAQIREEIDIGGVALIRAAAKNHPRVAVAVDPADYPSIVKHLDENGGSFTINHRLLMAQKAFSVVSAYDLAIARWFTNQGSSSELPEVFAPVYRRVQSLRYGENPHQVAAFYRDTSAAGVGLPSAQQLAGKELSYNNIMDVDAAIGMAAEFLEPTVVLVKHSNPCGLACAPTVEEAFRDAYTCDPVSAFGGILAVNRPFTLALAQAIVDAKLFLEIIVAPDFERGVLQRFAKRTDLRLLKLDEGSVVSAGTTWDLRGVQGGLLLQSRDSKGFSVTDAKVVTERKPTPEELAGLVFAFRAVKCVKSNGIVLTQGLKTVGIGAGQTSRVDSVRVAVQKAGERAAGAFLGSDAFFPFPDGVEEAARAGVRAIIQPGGSKQDPAVIEAANRLDLCMVLTGQRHFRH